MSNSNIERHLAELDAALSAVGVPVPLKTTKCQYFVCGPTRDADGRIVNKCGRTSKWKLSVSRSSPLSTNDGCEVRNWSEADDSETTSHQSTVCNISSEDNERTLQEACIMCLY